MAKFGDGVSVPNQGSFTPPPKGYSTVSANKPGGTPTGSAPMLGGRSQGTHVKGIGGTGTKVSSRKPF